MKFAVFVTEKYIPGLVALVESIRESSGFSDEEIEFAVIKTPETELDRDKLPKEIKFEVFNTTDLGKFEFDESLFLKKAKKWKTIQNKILVFKLPYEENICYLDVDILCLGDITELKNFKPLTASIAFNSKGPQTVLGNYLTFCAGFFVFRPSNELFDEIQEFALGYKDKINSGDQVLLNNFFYSKYPNDVHLLGLEWGTDIRIKKIIPKHYKSLLKDQKVKFLHFTKVNPWMDYKEKWTWYILNTWRKFYWRKECKLWWEYYNRAIKQNDK